MVDRVFATDRGIETEEERLASTRPQNGFAQNQPVSVKFDQGVSTVSVRNGQMTVDTTGVQKATSGTPGDFIQSAPEQGHILATAKGPGGFPPVRGLNDHCTVVWNGSETSIGALVALGVLQKL